MKTHNTARITFPAKIATHFNGLKIWKINHMEGPEKYDFA